MELFESTVLEHLSPDTLSVDIFNRTIIHAAEKCIPRTSGSAGMKRVPWWGPTVEEAIKIRRKKLRRPRRIPDGDITKNEAHEEFKKARNESRKLIKEAKQKSWESFIQSFKPNTPTNELWRKFNALSGKRRHRKHIMEINGNTVEDPATIAEQLADHFYTVSATENYELSFLNKKHAAEKIRLTTEDEENEDINSDFSIEELMIALAKECQLDQTRSIIP